MAEEVEEEEKKKLLGHDGRAWPGIVAVNPKPSKGFTSKAIDYAEKLIVKLTYGPSQPLHYLSGDFGPVPETTPVSNLPITGHLPDCLNGEFVRVGPNAKFAPIAGYHLMIHGLRIKNGKATYVSRFVKTSKLKQEEFFGSSKFAKIGDLKGLFGLLMVGVQILRAKLKVLDVSYGTGTGEMFTFGYSQMPPYVTYRVISKDGFMHDPVPITIPESVMMHDFAITESYAIFMDLPFYFRPTAMVKGNKLPLVFDATKKARFGVLPRYAKTELQIRWFELPNCFIFHNANAWEEEDEVVLVTCRVENPDLEMLNGAVKETAESFRTELHEMRFNMNTGLASQRKLSESTVDFPRINEAYTGRKSSVNVIDAKTMSADPVAVVDLPRRVPYGFHALFVTEVCTTSTDSIFALFDFVSAASICVHGFYSILSDVH
ncbi:hypothetical protein CDL15_Pgr012027 [Punica granatum]|uniref:carotenoid 9,10-dioxygenase n=1 Tax=Punica granatum TaxID=22663 RepID=A0A218VUC7_PUNGR|nr:hypothetical protein CDL15_Pgr012027 [Punica granatum]